MPATRSRTRAQQPEQEAPKRATRSTGSKAGRTAAETSKVQKPKTTRATRGRKAAPAPETQPPAPEEPKKTTRATRARKAAAPAKEQSKPQAEEPKTKTTRATRTTRAKKAAIEPEAPTPAATTSRRTTRSKPKPAEPAAPGPVRTTRATRKPRQEPYPTTRPTRSSRRKAKTDEPTVEEVATSQEVEHQNTTSDTSVKAAEVIQQAEDDINAVSPKVEAQPTTEPEMELKKEMEKDDSTELEEMAHVQSLKESEATHEAEIGEQVEPTKEVETKTMPDPETQPLKEAEIELEKDDAKDTDMELEEDVDTEPQMELDVEPEPKQEEMLYEEPKKNSDQDPDPLGDSAFGQYTPPPAFVSEIPDDHPQWIEPTTLVPPPPKSILKSPEKRDFKTPAKSVAWGSDVPMPSSTPQQQKTPIARFQMTPTSEFLNFDQHTNPSTPSYKEQSANGIIMGEARATSSERNINSQSNRAYFRERTPVIQERSYEEPTAFIERLMSEAGADPKEGKKYPGRSPARVNIESQSVYTPSHTIIEEHLSDDYMESNQGHYVSVSSAKAAYTSTTISPSKAFSGHSEVEPSNDQQHTHSPTFTQSSIAPKSEQLESHLSSTREPATNGRQIFDLLSDQSTSEQQTRSMPSTPVHSRQANVSAAFSQPMPADRKSSFFNGGRSLDRSSGRWFNDSQSRSMPATPIKTLQADTLATSQRMPGQLPSPSIFSPTIHEIALSDIRSLDDFSKRILNTHNGGVTSQVGAPIPRPLDGATFFIDVWETVNGKPTNMFSECEKLLLPLGAKVKCIFPDHVNFSAITHILWHKGRPENVEKIQNARQIGWRCPAVTTAWIHACNEANRMLPTTGYEVDLSQADASSFPPPKPLDRPTAPTPSRARRQPDPRTPTTPMPNTPGLAASAFKGVSQTVRRMLGTPKFFWGGNADADADANTNANDDSDIIMTGLDEDLSPPRVEQKSCPPKPKTGKRGFVDVEDDESPTTKRRRSLPPTTFRELPPNTFL